MFFPLCAAYQLARLTKKAPNIHPRSTPLPTLHMNLKTNDLLPGDCITMDYYESKIRGRLTHTKGKERETEQFRGGIIAVDHASSKIYI